MTLPPEFLAEVKYRNNLADVAAGYINLKKAGANFSGLCPFHNEKTPSFTIFTNTDSYYCFGCGAGGDVVTFILQIENLDYIETIKFLAAKAGLNMPEDDAKSSAESKLKQKIFEINRETARFFHTHLAKNAANWRGYLKERGVNIETIKKFGIGAAPDSFSALQDYLKGKGFKNEEIFESGLIKRGKNGGFYDTFRARLIFPIIDLRGNVLGFGARVAPGAEGPKYINSSDSKVFKKRENLYALNFAKSTKDDYLILCEGYMDVVALHQVGINSAVAALGTSFADSQAKLISRYTQNVVLALDADNAGARATKRAIEILRKTGLNVKVIAIPEGLDPDDYIKKHGAAKFKALIDGAANDTEYRLFIEKEKFNVETDDGKLRFMREAVKILAQVDDPIERDVYAAKLANETKINKSTILEQIKKISGKSYNSRQRAAARGVQLGLNNRDNINPERHLSLKAAKAEEYFIKILMDNPDLCEAAKEALKFEDFVTSFNAKVYAAILRILESGLIFDTIYLAEEFTPLETGRIVEILDIMPKSINPKDEIVNLAKVIKAEKSRIKTQNIDDLSEENWAYEIEKIAKIKMEESKNG